MIQRKTKQISSLPVLDFFQKYGASLKLEPLNDGIGVDKEISQPAINRPGLALAGFMDYFAFHRVQVLGNSEISYLSKLNDEERVERFRALCDAQIPCIVIARSAETPPQLLEVCTEYGIALFRTPLTTMRFMNSATLDLETSFAESTTAHGCMVDYSGVGILITGASGTGKSETAIGLMERGGALVADDLVRLHNINDTLIAETDDFSKGFMEMRGIGIINVANLYGLGSIRQKCNLDLIVDLVPQTDMNTVDRLGLNRATQNILGVEIPKVEIPVAAGRDTSRLVAVTALDFQLRKVGYDMAGEFNRRLLHKLNPGENF